MSDGKLARPPAVIARRCLYFCLCAIYVTVSTATSLSAAPGADSEENLTASNDGTIQLNARPSVVAAGNEIEITAWLSTSYGYPEQDVRIRFSLGDDSVDRFIDVGRHGAASLTYAYPLPGEYTITATARNYQPETATIIVPAPGIDEIKWTPEGRSIRYAGDAFIPVGEEALLSVEPASQAASPSPGDIRWTLKDNENGNDIILGSGTELTFDETIYDGPGKYEVEAAVLGRAGENYSRRTTRIHVMAIYYKREGVDNEWRGKDGESVDMVSKLKGRPERSRGTEIVLRHTLSGLEDYPELDFSRDMQEGVHYRRLENKAGEPAWRGPEGVARLEILNTAPRFRVRWRKGNLGHGNMTTDTFYPEKLHITAMSQRRASWDILPSSRHGASGRARTRDYRNEPEDTSGAVAVLLSPYVDDHGNFVPVAFDLRPYFGVHQLSENSGQEWSIAKNPDNNATLVEGEGEHHIVEIDTAGDGGAGKYQAELRYLGGSELIDAHVVLADFEDSIGIGTPPYPEYILSAQHFAYPFIVGFDGPENVTYDVSSATVRFQSDRQLDYGGSFDKVQEDGSMLNIGTSFENVGVSSGSDGYLFTLDNSIFQVREADRPRGEEIQSWQNSARISPWITAEMVLPDGYHTTLERITNRPVEVKWAHPDLPVAEIGENPDHYMTLQAADGYYMRPDERNPNNIVTCESAVTGFTHRNDLVNTEAAFSETERTLEIKTVLHTLNSSGSGEEWLATQSASYYIAATFSYPENLSISTKWGKNGVCDLQVTSRRLYPEITPGFSWQYSWEDIAARELTMVGVWAGRATTGLSAAGLGAATVATGGKLWISAPVVKALGAGSLTTSGMAFLTDSLINQQTAIDFSGDGSGASLELHQHAYFAEWGEENNDNRHHENTFPAFIAVTGSGDGEVENIRADNSNGHGLFGRLHETPREANVGDSMVGGWQGTVMLRNKSLGWFRNNEAEAALKGESLQPEVNYDWR